ncbi:MAG TPA: ATP-binding protein [Nevskiaceae bacterium]|nr:ATP-binding protein [Nevskiaceae bacterium]
MGLHPMSHGAGSAGSMAARIQAHDWKSSPLGTPRKWPQSLRTALSIVLDAAAPMALVWGEEQLLFCNDAWQGEFGEVEPGRSFDACFPQIAEQLARPLKRVMGDGQPQRADAGQRPRRHGFALSAVRGEHDSVAGVLIAPRTAPASADDALDERLTELFRHAPVGIAVLRGPQHVYRYANAEYLRVVGNRDVLGRPVRSALPELAGQGAYELLDQVYASGEAYVGRSIRTRLTADPSGALKDCYFDLVFQPLRERGAVDGIVVIAFDITELAHARAQAESASAAKDTFLAMLGHELRNPLAPIVTALHLMRQRDSRHMAHERTVIERQVQHMVRLVDDLLDVSRITRGNVELQKTRVELADVVNPAIEMVSPLLEKLRHKLAVAVPTVGLPVVVDPTRLAQVLSNLLNNAAKFTEPGGDITLVAERDGEQIVLRVTDNGIGIAEDMLPKVFEMFEQGEQSLVRSRGGLGLGLTIARRLAELHGGTLEAHSEGTGKGSSFVLRLPAAPPEEMPQTLYGGDREALRLLGSRVLVVDDNEDAAQILALALTAAGHTTRVAHDGPTALELAQEFKPEVALLDIGLPVMDGLELGRRLRRLPATRETRLIAVTGYGQAIDRKRSLDAGFDAHLVKPVDVATLDALIKGDAAPPDVRRH